MSLQPSSTAFSQHKGYYERDVDFNELANRDPDFARLSRNARSAGWFDFQDPKVVKQLTKSILKHDFNLALQLPDDRLCPPVPVRWNYIRWIQDLLDTTSEDYTGRYDPEREVLGLDIGVGASCIYALLGCATRPNWRMAGTDIDTRSLECAKQNVEANGLTEKVRLKLVKADDSLVPLDAMGGEEMDFVMTNPPFYASREDFEADAKEKTPSSAITAGAGHEMICPGGDVGFVSRILEESLRLRERVHWYTAMLSKLSSLQQIVAKLKEHDITNYAVTSLHPGYKTKRWAVGWSFRDFRPRNDVSRHGELVMSVLPPVTAQTIAVPKQSAKRAGRIVDETLKALDVTWRWRPLLDAGVMQCKENVWSRAARRKKKFGPPITDVGKMAEAEDVDSAEGESVVLAVKITCREEEVQVRWLRGHGFLIFESFCGMLKRPLVGQKKS